MSARQLTAVRPPRFFRQAGLLKDPIVFFAEVIESHGDFVHYRGILDFYLINDAELVSHVFKQTNRQFNKETSVYRRLQSALGESLITAEGENWKVRRKMMFPTFTPAAVNLFFELMQEQATKTLTEWEGEMNFGPAMNHLTMEVSGKALLAAPLMRARRIFSIGSRRSTTTAAGRLCRWWERPGFRALPNFV